MPVWTGWLAALALALASLAGDLHAEPYPPAAEWRQAEADAFEREIDCLALNVYFEARSESQLGKLAVAAVTLNRVASPAFPDSVCAVVNQGERRGRHLCQFSWRCDGLTDTPANFAAWLDARGVAQQALSQPLDDPTGGALWYHADHVLPDWARDMRLQARIGHHLFYARRPRDLQIAGSASELAAACAGDCGSPLAATDYRLQLANARPLHPSRPLAARRGGTTLLSAGRIRLTPFERDPASAERYLALADYLGATATLALTDLGASSALRPPALAR